ncbi:DUF3817 domain-containing protein [Micromonospora sp. 15K316]|uniref:DUF3817 domain-containing protein n=1 Tax=Micromonospora sp. 15K316 TaxID=2530376 RepID=UPI001FB6BF7C|nr:DUF3817 domain-containing protein [Micromonospora sp. 15K316]
MAGREVVAVGMRDRVTKLFVGAAIAEACSWLGLLIGMAVKYGPPGNELGVKIFGPIHGGLFVVYLLLVLLVARRHRWSLLATAVALACAVPPFATLVYERWAHRRGMLGSTEAVAPPQPAAVR